MSAAPDALSGATPTFASSLGLQTTGAPYNDAQTILEGVVDEMKAVASLGGSPKLCAYARKWAATLGRVRDRGMRA